MPGSERTGQWRRAAGFARLPPGLAGARAGAAAAALAVSRARGLVGNTDVRRSALDARSDLSAEVTDAALAHTPASSSRKSSPAIRRNTSMPRTSG